MTAKFILYFLLFLSLFCVQAFAQQTKATKPPHCQIIRTVSYPVTQTSGEKKKLRISLLNLCPTNPGMEARPMYPMMIDGAMEMFEYTIDRVFRDKKEAKKYAKKNRIVDISF